MSARGVDLIRRRQFDFRVLADMQTGTFSSEAYATTDDLVSRRRPVTSADAAGNVSKYRFTFNVRTLIGPGKFCDQTVVGVDTDVVDYPRQEPNTWIISPNVPWSPHFRRSAPVCLGDEFWKARKGHVTLGHLAVHIARLLNWDEKGRGGGYVGWNPDAIAYHQKHYGPRPLDPQLAYPAMPKWLNPIEEAAPNAFRILSHPNVPPSFRIR